MKGAGWVRVRRWMVALALMLGILLGLMIPVRSQSLDQLHNQGVTLYNQGQYDQAAAVFLEALKINPRALPPLRYLGGSLVRLERYDDAVDILSRTLELNPYDADSLYDLGVAYDHLGQLDQAAEQYQKAAEEYRIRPNSLQRVQPEEIFNNLGLAQLAQDQPNQALSNFIRTTELDASFGQGFYLQGIAQTQQQDYPQARQSFDKSVDPQVRFEFRERGYNGRGVAELLDQDLDRSLQSLNQSLQEAQARQRNYPTALSNRGLTHFELGSLDNAESDFGQFTQAVPDRPEAFNNLGFVRYEIGEKARLIARSSDPLKFIATLPAATAHYFQDQVQLYAQRHPVRPPLLVAALPFVNDAPWLPALPPQLQPDPQDPMGLIRLALSDLARTKLEEAIQAFRQALEIERNYAPAHYGLAASRRSQGRFQESLQEFETAGTLYASAGDTLWEAFTRQLDLPALTARIETPEPPANSVNPALTPADPYGGSANSATNTEAEQPQTPTEPVVRDGFRFTEPAVVAFYDTNQTSQLLADLAISTTQPPKVRSEAVQALRLKRYRPAYPALQSRLVKVDDSYAEPDQGVRSSILYFLDEVEAPPPPAPVAAIPVAAVAPPRPRPAAAPQPAPQAIPVSVQQVNTSFAPPPTPVATASGCGGSSIVSAAICRIRS